LLNTMIAQALPEADKYKRSYINSHIDVFRRGFTVGCQKEFEKNLTYAQELQSVTLEKNIYDAAMQGLQATVQGNDFKARHWFNPTTVAEELIMGAFSFQDPELLKSLILRSNQENLFGERCHQENIGRLITKAQKEGLLDSLKPTLGIKLQKLSADFFDREYYRLGLLVKELPELRKEYEEDIEQMERYGVLEKALDAAQLMGDEKRIEKYKSLVELVRKKESKEDDS